MSLACFVLLDCGLPKRDVSIKRLGEQTKMLDQKPSKHMYLGHGISSASAWAKPGESSHLHLDQRSEMSESGLADLLGLPAANLSITKDSVQSFAQLPKHAEIIQKAPNPSQTDSFCVEGFDEMRI